MPTNGCRISLEITTVTQKVLHIKARSPPTANPCCCCDEVSLLVYIMISWNILAFWELLKQASCRAIPDSVWLVSCRKGQRHCCYRDSKRLNIWRFAYHKHQNKPLLIYIDSAWPAFCLILTGLLHRHKCYLNFPIGQLSRFLFPLDLRQVPSSWDKFQF